MDIVLSRRSKFQDLQILCGRNTDMCGYSSPSSPADCLKVKLFAEIHTMLLVNVIDLLVLLPIAGTPH